MFVDSEWKIETSDGNFSAGLSKLHSKYPEESFAHKKNVSRKISLRKLTFGKIVVFSNVS